MDVKARGRQRYPSIYLGLPLGEGKKKTMPGWDERTPGCDGEEVPHILQIWGPRSCDTSLGRSLRGLERDATR